MARGGNKHISTKSHREIRGPHRRINSKNLSLRHPTARASVRTVLSAGGSSGAKGRSSGTDDPFGPLSDSPPQGPRRAARQATQRAESGTNECDVQSTEDVLKCACGNSEASCLLPLTWGFIHAPWSQPDSPQCDANAY